MDSDASIEGWDGITRDDIRPRGWDKLPKA